MAKHPTIVTPRGVFSYVNADKPDTGRKFSSNKYGLEVRWAKSGRDDQEAVDAFVERIRELHEAAGGEPDTCPLKDGDATKKKKNEETGQFEMVPAHGEWFVGHWYMKFKSKSKPATVDAKKQDIPASLIMGGDEGKVVFGAGAYEAGQNFGLTGYLNVIQLLKKGTGNNAASVAALDEEEDGYVLTEEDAADAVDSTSGDY